MFFSDKLNSVMMIVGKGRTQVQVVGGVSPEGPVAAVIFKPLISYQEVGSEISDDDQSQEQGFGLHIDNIEGLEILERALAFCREKMNEKGEPKP